MPGPPGGFAVARQGLGKELNTTLSAEGSARLRGVAKTQVTVNETTGRPVLSSLEGQPGPGPQQVHQRVTSGSGAARQTPPPTSVADADSLPAAN